MLGHCAVDNDARYAENKSRCLKGQRISRDRFANTYDESEANEAVDGGAIFGLGRVVFGLRQTFVYQAEKEYDEKAVDKKTKKL